MDECQNVINFEDFDAGTSDAVCEMGQSESKKKAKRQGVSETKGTAMSFGFKKKTGGILSNKKSTNAKHNEKEKLKADNEGKNTTSNQNTKQAKEDNNFNDVNNDNNGNEGSTNQNTDHDDTKSTACSTPRLMPPKKDASGVPYRQNRFGFRQTNIIRPASAGITPKLAENDCITNNNSNNNNNNYGVTEKRRSKSATGTSSTRTNASPSIGVKQQHQQQNYHQMNYENPKINTPKLSFHQQQLLYTKNEQEQNKILTQTSTDDRPNSSQYINKTNTNDYTVINSNSTNPIVRPTPQRASETVSKFTLHTMSLPKPQYPVSISLPPRNVMDTKVAKQALNSSKRGFQGEISTDSGNASFDSYGALNNSTYSLAMRNRPRNLQMIMRGKNSFEVRDLDDSLSEDSVVPLALPKLPSAFSTSTWEPAPLSGLVHDNFLSKIKLESDMRKGSFASSDIESLEEDDEERKMSRDKSNTEKLKHSSPVSSTLSWEQRGGEQMAIKDCSSLSISSNDDIRQIDRVIDDFTLEEDISSVTLTTGNILSELTTASFNKAFEDHVSVKNILLTIKDKKFAEMAEAIGNDTLLDDETSPTDSLVSSCTESDEILGKKNNKKKIIDKIITEKEIEIEFDDLSSDEINLTRPLSPGTPTHADGSNSFSLSDGAGRDFLIDDEIADQPALVYDGKDLNDELTASLNLHSITDTPTLMETGGSSSKTGHCGSGIIPPKFSLSKSIKSNTSPKINNSISSHHSKPKNPLISRAESLDTLSPCDSIASDDLMMDFDCNSSLDSIDREGSQRGSGSASALHSMDEAQLWSELEAYGGDITREWTLLRNQIRNSRESITPLLPARATRLLNRRLQQTSSAAGSDSPRSLDSVSRRTPLFKSHTVHHSSAAGSDDMILIDKSFKTSVQTDLMQFKKQLVRLRRILQETETLNPFEHSQYFASCGIDLKSALANSNTSAITTLQPMSILDDRDNGSLTPSSTTDDPIQELADLRRQVVFLQGQIDDKDRTIRLQQNIIAKLEEKEKNSMENQIILPIAETISTATQTERLRPLSMGQEGLARSEHQNHHHQQPQQQQKQHQPIRTISNSTNSTLFPKKFTNISVHPKLIQNNNNNNIFNNKNQLNNLNNNLNIHKTVHTKQIGNVTTTKKSY